MADLPLIHARSIGGEKIQLGAGPGSESAALRITDASQSLRSDYNELSTVENTALTQFEFPYGKRLQNFFDIVSGSGVASWANAMINVSAGAGVGFAFTRTFALVKYRSGQSVLVRFSAVFAPQNNTSLSCGAFDSNDGCGFGFRNNVFGVFVRGFAVETFIAQNDWNIDKLDGSGDSSVTWTPNNGFGNVYQAQFHYLGFGGIAFFVQDPATHNMIRVHDHLTGNNMAAPFFQVPTFPLAIEASATAGALSAAVVHSASWSAFSQGINTFPNAVFTRQWEITTVPSSEIVALALRNIAPTFNGVINKVIQKFEIINIGNEGNSRSLRWRLYFGGTFAGDTWAPHFAGETPAEYLTAGTYNLDGILLIGGNVPIQNVISENYRTSNLQNAAPLIAVLTIYQNGGAAQQCPGTFTWTEFQ